MDTLYCACDTPAMDVAHDAGCRRCGLPVDFSPKEGRMETSAEFAPGTRVKVKLAALGTIRLDQPYAFTDYICAVGDTGTIYTESGAMPEGWVLVHLDHKHDDGSDLYAPVHPAMLERADA